MMLFTTCFNPLLFSVALFVFATVQQKGEIKEIKID